MSHLRFESNVNYDLGKTAWMLLMQYSLFESNVNYDLGKTHRQGRLHLLLLFESNVNYDLGKTGSLQNGQVV